MLVIRLVRLGRRNLAHYRLVVSEKRSKLRGRVVDLLGSFNPHTKAFSGVAKEKVEAWVKQGAQVSNSAARLLNKEFGFNFPVRIEIRKSKKKAEKPTVGGGEQKVGAEEVAAPAAGIPAEGVVSTDEKAPSVERPVPAVTEEQKVAETNEPISEKVEGNAKEETAPPVEG